MRTTSRPEEFQDAGIYACVGNPRGLHEVLVGPTTIRIELTAIASEFVDIDQPCCRWCAVRVRSIALPLKSHSLGGMRRRDDEDRRGSGCRCSHQIGQRARDLGDGEVVFPPPARIRAVRRR